MHVSYFILRFLVSQHQFLFSGMSSESGFLMNPVKKTLKSLLRGYNRKVMEKWSEFLGKKKLWLGKVTSVLCGKPENNPFGRCILVCGKQTGSCISGEKSSPKVDFNLTRTTPATINDWNTHAWHWVFQICKEKGTVTFKMRSKGWVYKVF